MFRFSATLSRSARPRGAPAGTERPPAPSALDLRGRRVVKLAPLWDHRIFVDTELSVARERPTPDFPSVSRSLSGMAAGSRFPRTIVRCSQGALYSTIWLPLGSLKAIRLGSTRVQRCPVHHKWERVSKVDPASLTSEELASAMATRDTSIP